MDSTPRPRAQAGSGHSSGYSSGGEPVANISWTQKEKPRARAVWWLQVQRLPQLMYLQRKEENTS